MTQAAEKTHQPGDNRWSPSSNLLASLWMAALALLTLFFFLSFFNRFAGLRSGDGEFTGGIGILHGKLPYRDYFNATPPLNALKSALLLKLFGPMMIVNRIAGVCERVVIAVVMFQWLCRLFSRRFAFTGALVTIILSAGDIVDPIASYNHDAILWAILSGFIASYVLDSISTRRLLLCSILSGLFAGLSLITKQTVGLGAAVAVPFVVALLLVNSRAWRALALWIAGFVSGCAVPVLLLAIWLHHLHAWMIFLSSAFIKGPAAKGGHPGAFLEREAMVAGGNWFLVLLALVAVAFTARAILASQNRAEKEAEPTNRSSFHALTRLFGGFAILIFAAELLHFVGVGALHNLSKSAVYFAFIVCAVMLAAYAVAAPTRTLTPRQRQFALLAAVSFFVAFFLSLSWPAFEPMLLPGLAFLIAAVLDGIRPKHRLYVYAALGFLIFMQVLEKLDVPFAFDGLLEAPVRLATQPSSVPELRGLRLSPDTNAFIDGTLHIIAANSNSSDTIFTYPEMSVFYALSDRGYPTLTGSHNVDVVNDTFAAEEAERILTGRPAAVITYQLSPEEVAHEDAIWRFGKPSGQHILVQAIARLTASYRVAAVYSVGQTQRKVVVYVRP